MERPSASASSRSFSAFLRTARSVLFWRYQEAAAGARQHLGHVPPSFLLSIDGVDAAEDHAGPEEPVDGHAQDDAADRSPQVHVPRAGDGPGQDAGHKGRHEMGRLVSCHAASSATGADDAAMSPGAGGRVKG